MRVERWDGGVLVSVEEVPDSADVVRAELDKLDRLSIRAIREYLAAKADAPQAIKDREAAAVAARARLAGAA